ncbi:hypothetical protein [Bradyrhizobium sp. OAE829]|uniref:hypothetical protein n=1 Tax=Bradyrhizobium sp. OAE829 TaxID=2663807 RepID=UPI0017899680
MSNHASMLTDNDLDAVSGGKDTTVRFNLFGFRISISTFDTGNGPATCTTVRTPSGRTSHDCTVPV